MMKAVENCIYYLLIGQILTIYAPPINTIIAELLLRRDQNILIIIPSSTKFDDFRRAHIKFEISLQIYEFVLKQKNDMFPKFKYFYFIMTPKLKPTHLKMQRAKDLKCYNIIKQTDDKKNTNIRLSDKLYIDFANDAIECNTATFKQLTDIRKRKYTLISEGILHLNSSIIFKYCLITGRYEYTPYLSK